MNGEIFRKKSLNKVKSPENLDEYIRVSNPGIWLILVSVILLLAGACVWGIFGHIDSAAPVSVRVERGTAVCTVSGEEASSVTAGMTVKYADRETVITRIGPPEGAGLVCELSDSFDLPDGTYEGEVILQSFRPISFILN